MMQFEDGAPRGFREVDFAIETPKIILLGPTLLRPLSFF
jgi:hypothetical protein